MRDNRITFSSGHYFEPSSGIVGLSRDLEIFEGFDSSVDWPPDDDAAKYAPPQGVYTADDMRELADVMIYRWTKFKEGLP